MSGSSAINRRRNYAKTLTALRRAPIFAAVQSQNNTWLFLPAVIGAGILALLLVQIPDSLANRDWAQDYISGRASLSGRNPYDDLNDLSRNVLQQSAGRDYRNPHPPVGVALAVPFTLFGYFGGSILWLLAELAALIAAMAIVGQTLAQPSPWRFGAVVSLLLLVWPPLLAELANGNFQTFALVLLVLAWRSLLAANQGGRDWQAGAWLGAAIALKMAGLLVFLWALMMRRWRVALASIVSWVGCHLLACLVLGWRSVLTYYTEVAGALNERFITSERNFSLYGLAYRFFVGTSTPTGEFYPDSAVWYSPHMARPVAMLLVTGFVALALWAAKCCRDQRAALAGLILAGAVVLPVAWDYYLLFALPALLLVITRTIETGERLRVLLLAVAFSLAGNTLIAPVWRQAGDVIALCLAFWPLVGVFLLICAAMGISKTKYAQLCPNPAIQWVHLLLVAMTILLLVAQPLPAIVAGVCLSAGGWTVAKKLIARKCELKRDTASG
jgi:hypothetical protein